MPFNTQGYELVERPGKVDVTETVEYSSQKLANDAPEQRRPQKLGRFQFFPYSLQLLLTVFPIAFIALAGAAVALDKKPTSATGHKVQRAISLAPTAFPIVFAAIVGRFFRALGLFWAERGVKLGVLERLIGSQSLFGTFERQFALRGHYLAGILMILLWALSPVGGQAALRLLEVVPRVTSTNSTLRYLPIAAQLTTIVEGASGASSGWSSYAPIYMTALTTSRNQQNATQDLFGNVRIPSIDSLAASSDSGNRSAADWVQVDYNQDIPYSSMLGVPVAGIPSTGNLSFNIISTYLVFDCYTAINLENSGVFINGSDGIGYGYVDFQQGGTFSIDAEMSAPAAVAKRRFPSFNMTSMNTASPLGNFSSFNCSLEPRNVESTVFCGDASCQVTAMRNLTGSLDLLEWSSTYLFNIIMGLVYLPLATIPSIFHGTRLGSTMTEMWLQEPYSSFAPNPEGEFSNLSRVPLHDLSRNFEVLFNTFWDSTFAPSYRFGNLSADLSQYDNITGTNPTLAPWINVDINFNTSRATHARFDGNQYDCNKVFAALLLGISCILFLAGAASLILMAMTLAPDIIGYVSSFTRDNPYAGLDQPSHLDGLDRAIEIQNLHVTLGDVNPGDEKTGHIAFAATASVQRLHKDRLYD